MRRCDEWAVATVLIIEQQSRNYRLSCSTSTPCLSSHKRLPFHPYRPLRLLKAPATWSMKWVLVSICFSPWRAGIYGWLKNYSWMGTPLMFTVYKKLWWFFEFCTWSTKQTRLWKDLICGLGKDGSAWTWKHLLLIMLLGVLFPMLLLLIQQGKSHIV